MLKMEEILNSTVEITIIDPFSQCTYYLISKYDTCQYNELILAGSFMNDYFIVALF